MTIENSRQAAARLAQEQRRARTIQEQMQQQAADIRTQAAGISPQVAATMGPALDPTKGFSMAPGARPADLPEPGSSPGGQVPQRTGNMFEGIGPDQPLPDDHDQLVGQGIGGAPRPQAQAAPQPQPAKPVKLQHPVLASLREDLGIEQHRPVDVKVGGHIWTMMPLTPGDIATAMRLAETLSSGVLERHLTQQTAVLSHAIMAIDSVPTYQVFGVEPPPGVAISDPMRPPRVVRYLAAGHLYDFIVNEGKTLLSDRLYEAYMDKVDSAGNVTSYLDDPLHRRVTFACPESGCDQQVTIKPRYKPGTQEMVVPVCQWHAEPLQIIEEADQSPLG